MKRVRRIALAGIVWLTAAAVAWAGTPRLVCACPDGGEGGKGNSCARCRPGRAKSTRQAPRRSAGTKACPVASKCCCCRTEPGPASKPQQAPAGKSTPEKARLTSPTCVKAPARAEPVTPSHAPAVLKDLTAALFVPAPILDPSAPAGPAVPLGEIDHTLPPADLLALCQRLLI